MLKTGCLTKNINIGGEEFSRKAYLKRKTKSATIYTPDGIYSKNNEKCKSFAQILIFFPIKN